MPELRRDVITGAWMILAPERARQRQRENSPVDAEDACPLCQGNEHTTPPEIRSIRDERSGNAWRVRVFPNPRPSLRVEGDLGHEARGIYDAMRGIGAHEVIVDTPQHGPRLHELEPQQLELILGLAQERIRDLSGDIRLHYVYVFKDQGPEAGASLQHPCTQLIALPMVPHLVEDELAGSTRYFDFRRRCPFCDVVAQESTDRSRIVYENERALVITPFAPRVPFECWILPRHHESRFEYAAPECVRDVADALLQAARRIECTLDGPAIHYAIHTAPLRSHSLPHYHWHIELQPVLAATPGPARGGGFHVSAVLPEEAAQLLRDNG